MRLYGGWMGMLDGWEMRLLDGKRRASRMSRSVSYRVRLDRWIGGRVH